MTRAIAAMLCLVFISGCGGGKPATTTGGGGGDKKSTGGASLPEGLMLKTSPGEAKDVAVVRKDAKDGDEVIVRGQIGGDTEVYMDNKATVLLADMSLVPCSSKEEDCPAPWDFCCEDRKGKVVDVQIPGKDGKALPMGLKGVAGLEPLNVIVVKGKVSSKDDAVTINASGIFVEKVVELGKKPK